MLKTKLVNPTFQHGKVYLVYGKKGAGKSTFLAKACHLWDGPIYSFCGEYGIQCPQPYYDFQYPKGSLIIIDEVSLVHRSRDFKTFPPQAGAWYKHVRKMGITVILTSQVDDVDKTLRSQADYVLVLESKLGPLQVGHWYKTSLVIAARVDDDGVANGAAEIAMGLTRLGTRLTSMYVQAGYRYWKYFDSYRMYASFVQLEAPAEPEPEVGGGRSAQDNVLLSKKLLESCTLLNTVLSLRQKKKDRESSEVEN